MFNKMTLSDLKIYLLNSIALVVSFSEIEAVLKIILLLGAEVGGKPKTETSKGSSHMYGLAADIRCTNSTDRFHLIFLLQETGFQRIGVADTFIHIDLDFDKSQQVMWTY
jgi:hypothetical protein